MTSNLKYFSVAEADELLPELTKHLNSVLDLKRQIETRAEVWRTTRDTLAAPDEALIQGQIDFLISQLNGLFDQIESFGCLIKDVNEGLIDFPARVEGKEVYLCWKMGESQVDHWHGISEGARGRQPLKRTLG